MFLKENKVYWTRDYGMFKDLPGNRQVNESHIRNLMAAMRIKQLPIPVIVNFKMQVIDGQHRLEACKRLGLAVPYVIGKDLTLTDVHTTNSISKNWSFVDYLKGYAKEGLSEYVQALAFYEEFKMGQQASLFLWTGKHSSATAERNNQVEKFEKGKLKITDIDKCYEIAYAIKDLKGMFNTEINISKSSSMIAIIEMMKNENFNFDRLVGKIQSDAKKILKSVTGSRSPNEWRDAYQRVYNYNVRKQSNRVVFWERDSVTGRIK